LENKKEIHKRDTMEEAPLTFQLFERDFYFYYF
jgi:hypothetical protein